VTQRNCYELRSNFIVDILLKVPAEI
jgi:hypothetical protein